MQTKQKKTFKTKAKRKTYSLKKKSTYTSKAKVSARKKTLSRVRRGGTRSSGRAAPRIYTKNSITQKYNKIADTNKDIDNLIDEAYKNLKHSGIVVISMVWPDSKYAKDSNQKIILVKSNIAAKHMTIGRFYQKEGKYTAALNRYKIIINSFDETKFLPEALYRISEIYLTIGMKDESIKTAAILGHNYPQSEWYKLIYNQLNKIDNKSIFSKSFKKIFNE